ncbi:MAG: DUF2490 domain-containing protein [Saprospiraceae bacterium]
MYNFLKMGMMAAVCSALLLALPSLSAQSTHRLGFYPRINLSYPMRKKLKITAALDVRELVYNDKLSEHFSTNMLFTDVAGLLQYKTAVGQSAGVGYTLRMTPLRHYNLLYLQYNLLQKKENKQTLHRFQVERIATEDKPLLWRYRYRCLGKWPLQNEALHPKPLYIKAGSECLWLHEAGNLDLELRFPAFVGFAVNSSNTVEAGLEYWANGLLQNPTKQTLWWGMVWSTTL